MSAENMLPRSTSESKGKIPGLCNLSGRSQTQQYSPDLRLSNRLGPFLLGETLAGRPVMMRDGRCQTEEFETIFAEGRGLKWQEDATHASMSSARRLIAG